MRALLLSVVLCVAGQACATDKVYRWVDSQGVTHFGSAPPPDSSQAEEVKVRGTKAPTLTAETGPAPDASVADAAVDAQLSALDAEMCERARESVRVLREENVVVRKDNKTGERRVLSAAERMDAVKAADAEVARVCAPEPVK